MTITGGGVLGFSAALFCSCAIGDDELSGNCKEHIVQRPTKSERVLSHVKAVFVLIPWWVEDSDKAWHCTVGEGGAAFFL